MIYNNILEATGHTPLVRLNRLVEPDMAEVLVKFEALEVGGSIKTRVAAAMIAGAEKRGILKPDSIICEPTSGNQGIGLSLVGAVKGYHVRIIMPDSVSEERRKLCQAYGAEVVLIHDDGDIGKCIEQCLETALAMQEEDPEHVWVPQQFDNPDNPAAHILETGARILFDVDGPIDGFVSGFGTGGTLSGVGRVLRTANPHIQIWAAEPEEAAILSGGMIGTHIQMGIGDGLIPKNLDTAIYDRVVIVTDDEALSTARRLACEEGLMCGISSGTNVTAALRLARELGPGKRVVTILPDTAERYFSTPLFDRD
jgi:cysteine synthase A